MAMKLVADPCVLWSAVLCVGLASLHSSTVALDAVSSHAPRRDVLARAVVATGIGFCSSPAAATTRSDTIVRVLDVNIVKLEKLGQVRLAGVAPPKTLPACFDRSPGSRTRLLLPAKKKCEVRVVSERQTRLPSVEVFVVDDPNPESVNERIVRDGYALAVRGSGFEMAQAAAQAARVGVWRECPVEEEEGEMRSGDAEKIRGRRARATFDDVDGADDDDGTRGETPPPVNPGDSRGCADFATYEDAKRFFDTYYDFYGDVARLDRDGDGVPCPSLPHTSDSALVQLKRPRREGSR